MKLYASTSAVLALSLFAQLAPARSTTLQAPPQSESAKTPTSYVRVKDGGTKLRNLPDSKGEPVLDAQATALLAVYSERAGWLEVEPASGMKVWIHGSFLKPTATPGVVEVSANSVRMRPLPSSDEKSFPLPMKLDKGDRVRVIARADPHKRLEEDWVQVWSPPGARAFVPSADTIPFATEGEDSRKTWAAAVQAAQASMLVVEVGAEGGTPRKNAGADKAAPVDASAAKPAPKADHGAERLADADKLIASARTAEKPDFTKAKAAYQQVLAESPTGPSANTAQARLDEIGIREEIQRLKAEKTTFEKQRVEKLADAEAKLREVNQRHDPLWGRFQARGWLENSAASGGPPRYMLRWGGQDVAELSCASGRYDLERFVGFELGVIGVTQRAAVPAANGEPGAPGRIDATRIEVISAHPGG